VPEPIHIEGMGVIGSVLAWMLAERGVSFTWHDTEQAICAWPACTGSVIPAGPLIDQAGYRAWERWAASPPWHVSGPLIEPADYWYTTKRAPAGAPEQSAIDLGALRRYPQPSYHVNVPALVSVTRDAFRDQRRAGAPAGAQVVVAHGYSERLDHLVWGWSCLVELTLKAELAESDRRPCLYIRRNRFQVAYAYPCPVSPYWFAGSAHIVERPDRAREHLAAPYFSTWSILMATLTGGLVMNARRVSAFMQGWRPAGRQDDRGLVRRISGRLVTRPCGSSGVRWAPAVAAAVCERLGIGEIES